MNNLTIAYKKNENYDEAIPVLEKLLDSQSQTLGENHKDTLSTLDDLAYSCLEIKKHDDALAYYEDLLNKQLSVYGSDSIEVIRTKGNIAVCFGRINNSVIGN